MIVKPFKSLSQVRSNLTASPVASDCQSTDGGTEQQWCEDKDAGARQGDRLSDCGSSAWPEAHAVVLPVGTSGGVAGQSEGF